MKFSTKPQKLTLPDGKIVILPSEDQLQYNKFISDESDWEVENPPEEETVASEKDKQIHEDHLKEKQDRIDNKTDSST